MQLFSLLLNSNEPWHWSISGIIIGLVVPALLVVGNKSFGISSSLKHLCSIVIPSKSSFFNYNLNQYYWSFIFIVGMILGGAISHFTSSANPLVLGAKTNDFLKNLNLNPPTGLYPADFYNFQNTQGILLFILGGFLIGFGTRWANGCTSGHSIFGIANLKLSSLIATICFFIGGLLMTHFILPTLL